MCPSVVKPPELKWYGFGIDGVGFFAMDCQDLQLVDAAQTNAFVHVQDARGAAVTAEMIDAGLKKIVDDTWDFQVVRMSEADYAVCFPTSDSLRVCRNAVNLTLPVGNLVVAVTDDLPGPKSAGSLFDTWVRLQGVPKLLLNEDRLRAAMVAAGKPSFADELSLFKDEEVIMKLLVPDPLKLRTTIRIWVNNEAFDIKIIPDLGRRGTRVDPPPPPPPRRDDDEEDDSNGNDPH